MSDCRLKGGGQAQTLKMKKMLSFCEFMKEMLSFWKVILPKMRFGQAQILSYEENAFLLGKSEEHKFLLGSWEVILPKMRFGQAQTLSYIENVFLWGILKKMLSFWDFGKSYYLKS